MRYRMTDQDVFDELRDNNFFWVINNFAGKFHFQVRHRPSLKVIEGSAPDYSGACWGMKMAQDQILNSFQEAKAND